jgi:hypothetical protein
MFYSRVYHNHGVRNPAGMKKSDYVLCIPGPVMILVTGGTGFVGKSTGPAVG